MNERLFLRLPEDGPQAPESGVPPHTLTTPAIPDALAAWVAHATAYAERFAPGHTVVERVLPDGAVRLIVTLRPDGADVALVGASAAPVLLTLAGQVQGLSVTLRPGAAPGLFGIAAHELAGRAVPWDALVAPRHRDLPERLAAARDDAARWPLVWRALGGMARTPDPVALRRLAQAQRQLRQDPSGRLSVHALASGLQLSERRLQQVFAQQLGLSPSVWRRLQRLHGTLRLLRGPAAASPWADLALQAGYCDQAHLINEFRALCGLTPAEFRRRAVSHPSNTAAAEAV